MIRTCGSCKPFAKYGYGSEREEKDICSVCGEHIIKEEDLNFSYSHRGYTMLYKGESIGGAGVLDGVEVRNTKGNRDFFKEQGTITKRQILNGRARDYIKRIKELEGWK